MGDSNSVFNSTLDRRSSKEVPTSHDASQELALCTLFQSYGLVDVWRERHTSSQEFTLFSNPHQSFCRIDHVFLHLRSLPLVNKIAISTSPWSDHDPLVLGINLTGLTRRAYL